MKSTIFKEKVKENPDNPLFRFSLSQALFEEEAYAESIEHLEFCAGSRDDWMVPRILLGKALLYTQQKEKAQPILERALELAIEQHHEDPAEELKKMIADLTD